MDILNPITDITFRIGNGINKCYDDLIKDGYEYIDGDIRDTCGGKFCALGVKKYTILDSLYLILKY